jgi:hypothetical protein
MLALHVPMAQRILGVAPVELPTLAAVFGLAMSIVVAIEIHKVWWRARLAAR